MNTLLVWVLVIGVGSSSSSNAISLPMADLESCQRIQTALRVVNVNVSRDRSSQCVQIKVMVSK